MLYAGGRAGPCRAVQAGSGYWSQDGATQVLGLGEMGARPEGLWIRWPGGKILTLKAVPANRIIEVDEDRGRSQR